ncbi:MAG: hypothetical protein LBP42_01500 [Treponema sp.]|jgi:hypothetical protein|nr:hypothetical protein [Treponema sp.]
MDLQAELDNTASEIIQYVKNVFIIKGIYDHISKGGHLDIASPYLNIRDALFHYQRMYEAVISTDSAYAAVAETIVIEQRSSINEHLNRGIKDFAIQICSNYYIPILHRMMDDAPIDTMKSWLCHIYHGLKNLVAEIRLAGQRIARFDDADSTWLQRLVKLIAAFRSSIDKNQTSYDFYIATARKLYPPTRSSKKRTHLKSLTNIVIAHGDSHP